MSEENSIVAGQFEDAQQQIEAAHLGMWIFLATEMLFFGGLFLAYTVYRHFYFNAFAAGSRHTDVFYGTLNSVILLTSSFTMALAVQAARGSRKTIVPFLALTIFLGISFIVVKGFEYHQDIADRLVPGAHFDPTLPLQAQVFFWFYWTMTGLHGVHILIGLGVLTVMTLLALRGKYSSGHHAPIELAGLYWHFVDIVWLFLYPLLYLVGRHS